MRSLEQIIHDNGNDNTPALDTHNLTGRAAPRGVEPEWVPLQSDDPMDDFEDRNYASTFLLDDDDYEPGTEFFGWIDCE
jgi:hypothetical protein